MSHHFVFSFRFAALVLAVSLLMLPATFGVTRAAAQEQSLLQLNLQGTEAVRAWFGALLTADPAQIRPLLAPDFQIIRADGSGYDLEGFLASELPIIAAVPDIENLVATTSGDTMVTRYFVNINSTRDGKVVEAYAPRLTVFRKDATGQWLLVAHGNFAALEE
jgi:hypothetical protein